MRPFFKYLLLPITLFVAGCDISLHETDICDYRVQLRYSYNVENTSRTNAIGDYVAHIDEFIFDGKGVLFAVRKLTPDICSEEFVSELVLPAGRYSVIALGNIDGRSVLRDDANGDLIIGTTRREDIRLSLDNADAFADGTRGHCEELFHGYRTFTVRESGGASRVRVDMMNAHFELRFRVMWKNTTRTPAQGVYYTVLQDIPSEYGLMPEHIYHAGSLDAVLHEPTDHDAYPHTDNNIIHHIPYSCHAGNNILSHSNTTYLNADGEVWGKFVSYRIKSETDPVLMLYYAPDGVRSRGEDPMVLPREIRLKDYFTWMGVKLDHELKQEYALDIVVDGDQILISPFDQFGIADWNDGGHLN